MNTNTSTPVASDAARRLDDSFDPQRLIPVALARGLVGTALIWGWVLSLAFCNLWSADDGFFDGRAALSALLGCAAAMVGFIAVRRLFGRGPEFNRLVMVALSAVTSVAVVAVQLFAGAWPPVVFTVVLGVLWALEGAWAAYALRRSWHLAAVYSGEDTVAGRLASVVPFALAAAVIGWAVSHMDTPSAVVLTCALVPLSLCLLPQGRLFLGVKNWALSQAQSAGVGADRTAAFESMPTDEAVVEPAKNRGAYVLGASDAGESAVDAESLVPAASRGSDIASSTNADADADPARQAQLRYASLSLKYGLSEREHDLLPLLAEGLNAQEIADRVFVSRNTVKTHMAHIYGKLGIHARAELDVLLGVDGSEAGHA